MEAQWRSAIVSSDSGLMDKLLADEFLGISARGTLSDKQQYVHRIATHSTGFSTLNLIDMKIRVQPNSAVAISQVYVTGMLEGTPVAGTFRYIKVYAGSAGLWKITNFEATRVSQATPGSSSTDDGIPVKSPN